MSRSRDTEFDEYASSYTDLHRASIHASGEEPAYFSRYKAQYMAHALGPRRANDPLAVLDFGCGIGNSMPYLREAFPRASLSGVDPSTASIATAAEKYGNDVVLRVNADGRIPFPDASFDAVQAACVFHHIEPGQRQRWMEEIRRVVKPHGTVFVFEHNVLNPLTRKAVRDCPFDADAILLPRCELLDLFRTAGFSRIRARYIVFFPAALAALRAIEPYLGWLPLGAQYVVGAIA